MKRRLIVLVTIIAVLVSVLVLWYREGTSPVSSNGDSKLFIIARGETIRSIASKLKNEGFIRDPLIFFLVVKQKGVETAIQAGSFRLSPTMSVFEIVDELQHGTQDIWVTIPEGWRSEEIALELTQKLSIPEQEFLKYAEEGYMFPDTYLFPQEASASAVTTIMRKNFDKKVTEDIRSGIEHQGISLEDGITLASIVEREGRTNDDRPVIAGILLKRLKSGWTLDVDATIQYALGYQPAEKKWWKRSLTHEDKAIISPFNSYKTVGLPPHPISNPGLASIKAVAFPVSSDYWFYLHDTEGGIHYGKTIEEHTKNINTYLR